MPSESSAVARHDRDCSEGRWVGDGLSTIARFGHSNPGGLIQGDVAALLRRVADSIAELGKVELQNIAFHIEIDDEGDSWPSVTVYFHPTEGPLC